MKVCPFCGTKNELEEGIAYCNHCNRVYDSSLKNRLLSAFWLMTKYNYSEEKLKIAKLKESEAIFVNAFVENCYCYDDFLKVLEDFI